MNRIGHRLTAREEEHGFVPFQKPIIAVLIVSSLVVGCFLSINMINESDAESDYEDPETGIIYLLTIESVGTADVKGYSGSSSKVTIPSTVTKDSISYDVIAIHSSAFRNNAKITEVTIGASVTSIKSKAFLNSGLTSVVIPDSVTTIEYQAFANCTSLNSVTFGNNVSSLYYQAFGEIKFYDIDGKTQLVKTADLKGHTFSGTYPNLIKEESSDVVTIDGVIYKLITPSSGSKYVSVIGNDPSTIPNDGKVAIKDAVMFGGTSYDVTSVDGNAFPGCASVKNVIIPDSVTTIGAAAFKGCTYLESVIIGNCVTALPNSMFDGCSALKNLTLGREVGSFGKDAFNGCDGISMTILCPTWNRMFDHCDYLSALTIGSEVEKIEYGAFQQCQKLKSVAFENGSKLKAIDGCSFSGCIALASIDFGKTTSLETIGESAFKGCVLLGSVAEKPIGIPSSVEAIGTYAFYECEKLGTVTIPASVDAIEAWAFGKCSSLANVEIESGVKSIGSYAFCQSGIEHISIPDSIETIDSTAFQGFTFYNADGKTELQPTAENLAGFTFEGSGGRLVKKVAAVSHWVKYDADGGSSSAPENKQVQEGHTFTIEGYDGTKIGFTFGGWSDGTKTHQSGHIMTMGASDINLTAVWNPVPAPVPSHWVKYDADGGSAKTPDEILVQEGQTFMVEGYEGTKIGFTFGGWSYGGQTYQRGDTMTMRASDINLTAVWTSITAHSVTYDPNGGAGYTPVQTDVEEGVAFQVQGYTGIKDGCTFGGWSYNGKTYQSGDKITMGGSDIALTAIWNPVYVPVPDADDDLPHYPLAPVQPVVEDDTTKTIAVVIAACAAALLATTFMAFDRRS